MYASTYVSPCARRLSGMCDPVQEDEENKTENQLTSSPIASPSKFATSPGPMEVAAVAIH